MKTQEQKEAEARIKSFQKRESKPIIIPEEDKKEWERVNKAIKNTQRTRRVK